MAGNTLQLILYALAFGALGYLSGSLPFAVWITRLVKGVDVRAAGSSHATATNTIRQAGFLPGALVFVLDVAKGFGPTWLALHLTPAAWIAPADGDTGGHRALLAGLRRFPRRNSLGDCQRRNDERLSHSSCSSPMPCWAC